MIQNVKDSTKPLTVTMTLYDKKVPMEIAYVRTYVHIDTGSAITIFPEATHRAISTDPL